MHSKQYLREALAHARQLEWRIRAALAAMDTAPDLNDEQAAMLGWTDDDLDNNDTNPPTIEDELDDLPPHEGHGGAV